MGRATAIIFHDPAFLTYRQALTIGGNVKKGEHGSHIAFWKIGEYQKEDIETGEKENRTSVLLKTYVVFNLAQCEGITGFDSERVVNPIAECENLEAGMPTAPKREASDRAWYRPSTDTVRMRRRYSLRPDRPL